MYAKQNQTEHLCLIKMSMMMTHKKTYKQKKENSLNISKQKHVSG